MCRWVVFYTGKTDEETGVGYARHTRSWDASYFIGIIILSLLLLL